MNIKYIMMPFMKDTLYIYYNILQMNLGLLPIQLHSSVWYLHQVSQQLKQDIATQISLSQQFVFLLGFC